MMTKKNEYNTEKIWRRMKIRKKIDYNWRLSKINLSLKGFISCVVLIHILFGWRMKTDVNEDEYRLQKLHILQYLDLILFCINSNFHHRPQHALVDLSTAVAKQNNRKNKKTTKNKKKYTYFVTESNVRQ